MSDEAFERWVAVAGPRLQRSAYLLTGDWSQAQDLTQYACVETWSKWRQLDAPDAFAKVVMTRAVTKWWRRRWRTDAELGAGDRPQDPWAGVDRRVSVVRALMTLPPRQRAVLVMRYYDDLTEAQVAEALGCAVGTVKSTASRAIAQLRDSGLLTDIGADTAHE